LEDEGARQSLGAAARELMQAQYDLHSICLPRQIEWVKALGEVHVDDRGAVQ